jgi:hypothetical protein
MIDLIEIAQSWIRAANPTPAQQKRAEDRIKVCQTCPKSEYTKHLQIYICGECGCPLDKKIYTNKKPGCPLEKWAE